MRKFFLGFLMLLAFASRAQFHNEWIDYSKTYYKFKVGSNGLYRIQASALSAAGLSSASAESFQLWRNGVEVPIYTSKQSGAFSGSDYIEFWGQMNDGGPDKEMYRDPSYQLNNKWSLLTDTATYFLTTNTGGSNRRLSPTANNLGGNTLLPEPYFLYTAAKYYRDQINPGVYYIVGHDHLFSSSYDKGEGWTSPNIERNTSYTETVSGLYPASTGPAAKFSIALTGNAYNSRRYKVTINGDSVIGNLLPYMEQATDATTFNTSLLNSGSASVVVSNITDDCGTSSCPVDRIVIHKIEITYPRQFNFGGAANFEFSLPANANNSYIEISNFNHSNVAPVLYDLTNGKRYDANLSGSTVQILLQPSASPRNLVLVSEAAANVASIGSLQTRNFINYNTAATQGDYLIVSNNALFNGANGTNPVEEYRAYRASAQGGGHNAKIYLEDQLIDQFGYGIKKNPAGIRNFLLYALNTYPVAPKFVFIIGRGVRYTDQRAFEASSSQTVRDNLEKLNLVPTFGFPASDMMLAADISTSSPLLPLGRLTAITPAEVSIYLKKVKEYEQAQRTPSPEVQDKAWMKNIAHIIGAGDDVLDDILYQYMESYRIKAEDTLYGAKVTTFRKSSTNLVEQLSDADLTRLMNTGVSLITYYGHSSATTLEFNLDDPANYNNQGKYPMFWALGCNAGATFDYNEGRFSSRTYLSDKYVLAPDRGSINFVASTHFGVVHYLDIWNSRAYSNLSVPLYGKSVGEIMKKTVDDVYNFTTTDDFFARCNAEETVLNGDPAVTLNQQAKPDYTVTDTLVKVTPGIISVADQFYNIKVKALNLGKAVNKPVVIEVKRERPAPDQTVQVLVRDTVPPIRYMDSSISINVPIDAIRDKGISKITVTIDPDNQVDEAYETNNSVTKSIVILEDEARPVYPNSFAIVNQSTITLKVSTANPFSESKQYRMEIDTTELFNSPLKASGTVTSKGGLIEFTPGINFVAGTVYYWRVSVVPANNVYNWNGASFVYLPNSEVGFNQSHYFQHLKSTGEHVSLDTVSRTWVSSPVLNNFFIKNGVWISATTQEGDLVVNVNGASYIRNTCNYGIIINVFDKNSFKPWVNQVVNGKGLYNSLPPNCGASREWNFEFNNDQQGRKNAMDFLRNVVPAGDYVVVRNQPYPTASQNQFVSKWIADEAVYGTGNSLYQELKNNGVSIVDSFYRLRTFAAVYKKGSTDYKASQLASASEFDVMSLSVSATSSDSLSVITSPQFGPATTWKQAQWTGTADTSDRTVFNIIGVKTDGSTDTLKRSIPVTPGVVSIADIDARIYPYLQLQMRNVDTINYTPYQLKSWQVTGSPVPEGVLSPNIQFSMKDTVDVGEPLEVKIAFKNISTSAFADSLKVKVVVTDRNNSQRTIPVQKIKAIGANETATVQYSIDTKQLVGSNIMFLEVNPDGDQIEQYHFNNFAFRNFYVRGDTLNPLLDVTFDNVHILNRDIVSSKPDIVIKLKDEAKWMLLSDTSVATVQVRFPSGNIKTYRYNSDTLTFVPATGAPNASNTASIRLKPFFNEDGNYELIVTGKDMSNNSAGATSYRVGFQIINKAMISNMLNYPNPFTTSTAFVFTLTGSDVPQNIKIQILTVTGKIVREITKEELGPLHIGRNVTEFKWDGTDQFGQKLANGVYLYHVVTNQNGKSLEKYKDQADDTDKYFNKGYGKMYLMR